MCVLGGGGGRGSQADDKQGAQLIPRRLIVPVKGVGSSHRCTRRHGPGDGQMVHPLKRTTSRWQRRGAA